MTLISTEQLKAKLRKAHQEALAYERHLREQQGRSLAEQHNNRWKKSPSRLGSPR